MGIGKHGKSTERHSATFLYKPVANEALYLFHIHCCKLKWSLTRQWHYVCINLLLRCYHIKYQAYHQPNDLRSISYYHLSYFQCCLTIVYDLLTARQEAL